MTTPGLHIDHLFVFVEPDAPEAAALHRAGLVESYRRRHPGQGTANICYCFDDAYLELLWQDADDPVTAPAVARTRLAERAEWRRNGASPFGIALRSDTPDGPETLPFETWDYKAPFLPAGMAIPVATDSGDPRQPFLFRSPGSQRPDRWTDGRAGNRQQATGLAEIIGVRLEFPAGLRPAGAVLALAERGLLTLGESAAGPRMVLTLSRSGGGPPRRLSLPDFTWAG